MNDTFAPTPVSAETDLQLQRFSQGSDAVYAYLLGLSARLAALDGERTVRPSHVKAAASIAVDTGFRDTPPRPRSEPTVPPPPTDGAAAPPRLAPLTATRAGAPLDGGWAWRYSGLTRTEIVSRAIVVAACLLTIGYLAVDLWPRQQNPSQPIPSQQNPSMLAAQTPRIAATPPPVIAAPAPPAPPPAQTAAIPAYPPPTAAPAPPTPAAAPPLPPDPVPPPEPHAAANNAPPGHPARPLPSPPRPPHRFAGEHHLRRGGDTGGHDDGQAFYDLVRRFPPPDTPPDTPNDPAPAPYPNGGNRAADSYVLTPDGTPVPLAELHERLEDPAGK